MKAKPTTCLGNIWLYAIVFMKGASVMVIELLGTRLIALAIAYFLDKKLTDKKSMLDFLLY